MVDVLTKIITPATNYDLMTVDDLKLALGIADNSQDAALARYITSYSDVIAKLCNRVFARETLTETWRDLDSNRIFLSHYPIATETDITSVQCPRGVTTLDPSSYEIDLKEGQINLYATQSEPITVTYTGGYQLPDDAPPSLQEAMVVIVREARAAAMRAAVSGIRSMSHKESRVVYFDPNLLNRSMASNLLNPGIAPLVDTLLMHYVRIQV
jgi:Phage gp6-like head-tail connector protein